MIPSQLFIDFFTQNPIPSLSLSLSLGRWMIKGKEFYFFHPVPSHRPAKNVKITLDLDFIFITRLLVISGF